MSRFVDLLDLHGKNSTYSPDFDWLLISQDNNYVIIENVSIWLLLLITIRDTIWEDQSKGIHSLSLMP